MKKLIYRIVIIISAISSVKGQSIPNSPTDQLFRSKIPTEKVYLHMNSSLLFVGESLYYSFYCLNGDTDNLSSLSDIGYVELVSEDKIVVLKQKLKLEKGMASSDLFIPVSIPSGNYKIIGYTKWMVNQNSFFQEDISIINPYQENQKAILQQNDVQLRLEKPQLRNKLDDNFELLMDKTSFKKRSKVTLKMINRSNSAANLSMTVGNISPIKPNATQQSATGVLKDKPSANTFKLKRDSIWLPEVRGEIISGKIIPINDTLKVSNINISLSIPDKINGFIKIANTNNKGDFYFNISEEFYSEVEAVFQVIHKHKQLYKIELDANVTLDYSDLNFEKFSISPAMEKLIKQRSVYNQIENSYFSVKPDSIVEKQTEFLFNGRDVLVFDLDDYTRFNTVKETLVEIIEHVWATKENEKNVLRVRQRSTYYGNALSTESEDPLVLVDGVFVQDYNTVINYDARKVKTISVIRDKYVYGDRIYQGVILIQTKTGDFMLQDQGAYILRRKLIYPEKNKSYFKQEYSTQNQNRTKRFPDFRSQLLWEPHLYTKAHETQEISFYTSDVEGDFKVVLEGFMQNGKAISIEKFFKVR
ncbi:hypothetical protein MWU65_05835 [Cellulophaga sp. F20128]|uniref:hypothetical protein n=1 Tax=Cellulophaga sp. F20128 TaxID=2926413 RepID=UPI001FF4367B|nr:hypothetical protein [Cellulophaga sp. F20128]MCK0156690.1 hypothetical protein [Cellulophaga sp. F20128]